MPSLHSTRWVHTPLAIGVALVAALSGRDARATPGFPAAIARTLGTQSVVDCSVCHQGRTGRGTVTTAFGSAMRARGLVAYDEASLERALRQLETERLDSDSDGTPDTAELARGEDPNPTVNPDIAPVEPEYGCVGRVAPREPGAGHALLGAAGLTMLVVRVRLRRRARRGT